MAAVAAKKPLRSPKNKRPALALVTSDFENAEGAPGDPAQVTRELQQVDQTQGYLPQEEEEVVAPTAAQRIRQARAANRGAALSLPFVGSIPMWALLAGLVALLAVAGGAYLLRKPTAKSPAVLPLTTVTAPVPTPTGFGDVTATVGGIVVSPN